jgi:hypothetical protein
MVRELPKLPPAPDMNSLDGMAAWQAWWQSVNDVAKTEASKLLSGLQPLEAARRQWFEEAIIRHKLTEPRSYQCARGHFVKHEFGSSPSICEKCGDRTVECCECGASVLLTYTYKPPYLKVNPSSHIAPREVCFGCSRLYPWAHYYLFRPTEEDLTPYEELLLPSCDGFPERALLEAERQRLMISVPHAPVNFVHRLFGFRVDVSDPRHSEHARWQQIDSKYQTRVGEFRCEVLRRRRELTAAQLKAAQRSSFWKQLSGTEFEKHLAALLTDTGFTVKHVGGKGDEGADLIITGERVKIVVQCKAFSKPVGPGPVRDLYGALMHHQANEAWLVSLEGFSDAAVSFAAGKAIRLLPITAFLGAAGKQFLKLRKREC